MIRYALAIREALSLYKGYILVSDSLSELIKKPGFSNASLGHDRIRLTSTCLRPLKTIEQNLKLTFPSHKRSQSPVGTDIKPGSSGTGCDGTVDIYRLFFALIIILVLCAFDGVATIYHIIHGTAVEFNPIMDYAIQLGSRKFIVVKMALTFACLLMLVFYRHARGVKKVVLFIIFVYILLTIYHLFIFNVSLNNHSTAHFFPNHPLLLTLFQ